MTTKDYTWEANALEAHTKALPRITDERIQFYLPYKRDRVEHIPERAEDYWTWLLNNPSVPEGKYAWTLQTYLHLRDAGFPCEIVERFPSRGIVVAHRDLLPITLRPHPDVFLVCIKADRNMHTWAQYHVVQNESDSLRAGGRSVITHWPQPGLVPRDRARGTLCENVAYFGREMNLAPELRAEGWEDVMDRHGFEWIVRPRPQWNDYEVSDDPVFDARSKPPSKLINSWMAGVPAIVGSEPAYQHIRRSELDFIEVSTVADLRWALKRLRENSALYRDMVENGRRRAKEFGPASITAEWLSLFRDALPKHYQEWQRKGRLRRKGIGYLRLASYFTKLRHLTSLYEAVVR
jgi:hypothetical protein